MKKLGMHTANIVCENILKIKELFPNCIKEFKDSNGELKFGVDFEMLKQELSDEIIESDEKYEFNWPGKKEAILISNSPTNKTLRPCKEESVNWDTTQNLYLEGDNLEILKILRSTYLNKIKIIYIDPPYNTGKDYIYKDDFKESVSEYLAATGQIDDEGNRLIVSSKDTNGRLHSDWCSMIYSRLRLARDLLSDDGVIFISIDEHEQANLKKVCDDIFGAEQHLITIIQNKGNAQNDSENFQHNHDYVIVYAKQQFQRLIFEECNLTKKLKCDHLGFYYLGSSITTGGEGGTLNSRPNLGYTIYYNPVTLDKIAICDYDKDLAKISNDEKKIYHNNVDLINKGYLPIRASRKGKLLGCWTWSLEKFNLEKNKIIIKKNANKYNVLKKEYIDSKAVSIVENELLATLKKYKNVKSIWNFSSSLGTTILNDLFQTKIFNNSKNLEMIKYILNISATQNHIVLDFFSGSATTAHAVMQLNAEDGGNRRFIMVQLPEPCNENSEAFKAGYKNICEIGKERIRRAGKKIIEETGKTDLDIGFRVFKLDSSNMEDTYYLPQEYNLSLIKNKKLYENIKKDRTQEDLLFQVMLQKDFPLSAQIKEEIIDDKRVFSVDGNNLICCFEDNLTEDLITKIISQKLPRIFVTRNNSIDDNVLTNISPIIQVYSPETELEVI